MKLPFPHHETSSAPPVPQFLAADYDILRLDHPGFHLLFPVPHEQVL
jgi:hypothetical protein